MTSELNIYTVSYAEQNKRSSLYKYMGKSKTVFRLLKVAIVVRYTLYATTACLAGRVYWNHFFAFVLCEKFNRHCRGFSHIT